MHLSNMILKGRRMFSLFRRKKKKILVDNYDKVCHLLDIKFDPYFSSSSIGKCSLCGKENFIINDRCKYCRAKIEG